MEVSCVIIQPFPRTLPIFVTSQRLSLHEGKRFSLVVINKETIFFSDKNITNWLLTTPYPGGDSSIPLTQCCETDQNDFHLHNKKTVS